MLQNLYVNNLILGSTTEESIIRHFKKARTIMSEANFNLRSWASNSPKLQARIMNPCYKLLYKRKKVADANLLVDLHQQIK